MRHARREAFDMVATEAEDGDQLALVADPLRQHGSNGTDFVGGMAIGAGDAGQGRVGGECAGGGVLGGAVAAVEDLDGVEELGELAGGNVGLTRAARVGEGYEAV